MAKYVIDETTLKKIANAIREATGETNNYTLTEMISKTTALKDRILELEARSGPMFECIVYTHDGCDMYVRFQEGMTWGELADSPTEVIASYCAMEGMGMYYKGEIQVQVNNGYVVIPTTICCGNGGGYLLDSDGNRVLESDAISADEDYRTEPYTAYVVDEDGNTYELYFSPGATFEELEWMMNYSVLCHCGAGRGVYSDWDSESPCISECSDCGSPEMHIYDGYDRVHVSDGIIENHTYYAIPIDGEGEEEA